MAKCDVCGNDYDKSFQIISAGKTRTFDSFECAIHMLAPTCPHCNCKVIGHGVEAGGQIYCCVHCAEESGAHGLKDRSRQCRATILVAICRNGRRRACPTIQVLPIVAAFKVMQRDPSASARDDG